MENRIDGVRSERQRLGDSPGDVGVTADEVDVDPPFPSASAASEVEPKRRSSSEVLCSSPSESRGPTRERNAQTQGDAASGQDLHVTALLNVREQCTHSLILAHHLLPATRTGWLAPERSCQTLVRAGRSRMSTGHRDASAPIGSHVCGWSRAVPELLPHGEHVLVLLLVNNPAVDGICRQNAGTPAIGGGSGNTSVQRSRTHLGWWRGEDLNLRPSGYEPDELPDCSTPRRRGNESTDRRASDQSGVSSTSASRC